MISDVQGTVNQIPMAVYTEGNEEMPAMTKFGELFTADWKQRLIRAGLAWQVQVGGITAGADILPVTGGGNGTTMDTDQPELCVGVPSGYFLIPMEAHVATYSHAITDKTINTILLFADRTQSIADTAAASSTVVTPVNLLDGAAGSGTPLAQKAYTADVTDPVCSEVLDFACNQVLAATGSAAVQGLKMDYMPQAPTILAGPCQVVLCWGSTNATGALGIGSVKVAVVPSTYFPTG